MKAFAAALLLGLLAASSVNANGLTVYKLDVEGTSDGQAVSATVLYPLSGLTLSGGVVQLGDEADFDQYYQHYFSGPGFATVTVGESILKFSGTGTESVDGDSLGYFNVDVTHLFTSSDGNFWIDADASLFQPHTFFYGSVQVNSATDWSFGYYNPPVFIGCCDVQASIVGLPDFQFTTVTGTIETVSGIPEPSIWAEMLLGFLLTGCALRAAGRENWHGVLPIHSLNETPGL